MDRLVAAAKFGRQLPVARGLGQLLAAAMPALPQPPDAVVPVPLHWRREADRGFNQAEEIARGLCDDRQLAAAGGSVPPGAADAGAVRPSVPQAGGRISAARSLWSNPRALARCRHVLLVDDVLTTGRHGGGARRACFRPRGCQQLTVWTVAHTPPPADQLTARKV